MKQNILAADVMCCAVVTVLNIDKLADVDVICVCFVRHCCWHVASESGWLGCWVIGWLTVLSFSTQLLRSHKMAELETWRASAVKYEDDANVFMLIFYWFPFDSFRHMCSRILQQKRVDICGHWSFIDYSCVLCSISCDCPQQSINQLVYLYGS